MPLPHCLWGCRGLDSTQVRNCLARRVVESANHGSFGSLEFVGCLVPKTWDSLSSNSIQVSPPVCGCDRPRYSTDQKAKHPKPPRIPCVATPAGRERQGPCVSSRFQGTIGIHPGGAVRSSRPRLAASADPRPVSVVTSPEAPLARSRSATLPRTPFAMFCATAAAIRRAWAPVATMALVRFSSACSQADRASLRRGSLPPSAPFARPFRRSPAGDRPRCRILLRSFEPASARVRPDAFRMARLRGPRLEEDRRRLEEVLRSVAIPMTDATEMPCCSARYPHCSSSTKSRSARRGKRAASPAYRRRRRAPAHRVGIERRRGRRSQPRSIELCPRGTRAGRRGGAAAMQPSPEGNPLVVEVLKLFG
jgi:hypothetical protein